MSASDDKRARETRAEDWSNTRLGPVLPPDPESSVRLKPRLPHREAHGLTRLIGRTTSPALGEPVRLEPGKQVPGTPYRIVRWIGDGGMGIVYEAEHVNLNRRVALKLLRPEASDHVAALRLFRDEAKTLSKIGSDYIVEVFDLDELPDGRLWFAMELLAGTTLADELAKAAIEPARAVGILRQVCKGLASAHAAGIVHRDIKPPNIALVHQRGRDDRVKLLDFGVSTLLTDAEAGKAVRAGTPYYIAPEVVAEMPYDDRADLYSLGCSAYEMFAGRPPYEKDSLAELLVVRLDEDAPPLRETSRIEIPPALEAVVMRCLSRHQEDRYQSAADLEAALCEAQIEAGLRTPYDDLELPDVDPERRAKLLKRMPDPAQVAGQSRVRTWVALGGLAAAASLAVWQFAGNGDTAGIDAEVARISEEANLAAARSFYVYPPADAPQTPTAYRKVLELESLDGSADNPADERAKELRKEYAATLVRLGDHYWDRDGGRPFAIDYYAGALMFDAALEHARARVTMTPGELATLRKKASEQDFSEAELQASEALVALAEPDDDRRIEKLEELQADPARSSVAAARIAQIIEVESGSTVRKAAPRRPAPAPPTDPTPDNGDAEPLAKLDVPPVAGEPAPDEVRAPKRDTAAARALTKEGNAALKRGDVAAARRAFERAIAADARYAAAHDGLGRAHFHRGAYAEAARVGAKAARLAPRNAKYRIHLGDAYYKAFRYREARDQYQRAADLGDAAASARLAKAKAKLGG